jgi:hypothetical protein
MQVRLLGVKSKPENRERSYTVGSQSAQKFIWMSVVGGAGGGLGGDGCGGDKTFIAVPDSA